MNENIEHHEPHHLKFYLLLSLAFLGLLIYCLTLCPTVAGGDSGELTTVAHTLGIAHPPGYPLYTLLGKLFTFIPYGNIAWRVNFFSAFCTILTALILFYSCLLMTRNSWIAFLAGALYTFSPLVWRYSVVAEVFSLNNLLICGFWTVCLKFLVQQSALNTKQKIISFIWRALFLD